MVSGGTEREGGGMMDSILLVKSLSRALSVFNQDISNDELSEFVSNTYRAVRVLEQNGIDISISSSDVAKMLRIYQQKLGSVW